LQEEESVADSAKIKGFYPEIVVPKALSIGPKIQATFSKAYKAGVKIAFGTDASVYRDGRNAIEFQYMVEAGMPAMEAIKSATVSVSQLLGISDILGTIQTGKIADIIAVDGDPITNVSTLLNVKFVMKEGIIYKQ
jgi:imidazolonepropionase-like amidohydrolase